MALVFVALGSNQGDRAAQLEQAMLYLAQLSTTRVIRHSTWHETDPVGGPPQGKFFNGVAMLETALSPQDLLKGLLTIEQRMGRPAVHEKWGPRVIDLDLLSYDNQVVHQPGLDLPHPRIQERAFVLVPLAEIAPNWKHPVLGKTIQQLIADAHHPKSS